MTEYGISDDELEFELSDVEEDDFDTEDALRESAAGIIASKNVLENFAAAWRTMIAGEVNNAKLLYLVCTSRLFDRPMHAAIKGPSAAGKSEIRKRVLEFFPREAVLSFTMLSEKALLYFEQDFCHMILSMGEAAGSEEQQIQDYLLRELMSDGKLRYPVTVKTKDGLATHIIEKNGPVCFLVTTTKHALHHENETRMLSIEVDDSADQTSAVLLKIAETEGLNSKIRSEQYVQWQNFQRWLALGNCRVVVPYASVLAKLVQPKSVRLRRDFTQMLMAIKAHVLLHRDHRFTNDDGELSANMSDYAAVQELMSDLMAETSETKIKPSVQETVDALRTLQAKVGSEGVTVTALGKALRLDKSSALRRLRGAVDVGLVKNMETRKGWPGLYRTADVDLDTQELLPTVEELIDQWCKDAENAA
jgi:predicted transcriptional regulator